MADETKPAAPAVPSAAAPDSKKPAAPAVPSAAASKASAPAEKLVMLIPHDSVKHIITFGGHPRLFVKPGAPTAITPKDHAALKEDVGFQNLLAAGKLSVMA